MCRVNSGGKANARLWTVTKLSKCNSQVAWACKVNTGDQWSWKSFMGSIPYKQFRGKKATSQFISTPASIEDEAKSPTMIKHSLDAWKDAVAYLKPEQTPVVAFNQPVYVLAKKMQWHHPDTYDQMVTMMGPLHTEVALMNTIGDLLKQSGWTRFFVHVFL